jgi:hypothetical protein
MKTIKKIVKWGLVVGVVYIAYATGFLSNVFLTVGALLA